MTAIWWGMAFLLGAGMGLPALPGVGLLGCALVLRSIVSDARRQYLVLAAGAVLCTFLGAIRAPLDVESSREELLGVTALRGDVVGGVSRAGGRQRYAVVSREVRAQRGAWRPVQATVLINAPGLPEVHRGDTVRADGRLDSLDALPSSYRSYLDQRGYAGSMWAEAVLRAESEPSRLHLFEAARLRMDAVLQGSTPGDAGALLAGLVTGDDASLSAERQAAFRVAGLSHVTAISGSNVALLTTVLAGRRATAGRRRKTWLMVAVVLVIWSYAMIVQMDAPVVRASLTATLALIGVRLGRRVDYATLTVVSAVMMVMVEPSYVRGLAFQLSFVSATALIMMAQSGEALTLRDHALRAVTSVVVAQIAVLPLVLPLQQHVSLSAVPANLIVGPLAALSFGMGLLAAIVGMVWQPAGMAMAATSGMLCEVILRIVDVFGRPGAVVPLWSLSSVTVAMIGIVTAGGVWVLSGEGRQVLRRWARERHEILTRVGIR